MAVEDFVVELGRIGNWLEAIGLIVIIWIIVSGITLFFNRRRRKLLENIDKRLGRVERKLDMINRKKK